MLSGTVSAATEMHDLVRLIVFEIGEQVHLFCFSHYLWRIEWHEMPTFLRAWPG